MNTHSPNTQHPGDLEQHHGQRQAEPTWEPDGEGEIGTPEGDDQQDLFYVGDADDYCQPFGNDPE